MNKDRYLALDAENMCRDLLHTILINTNSVESLLKELIESEKYKTDAKFRLAVDSGSALFAFLKGEIEGLVRTWKEIDERALALDFWNVSVFSASLLGVLYHQQGRLEKALESYRKVIQIENEHGIIDTSSSAYNNIGVLYIEMKDFENALIYMKRAIELAEEAGLSQLDYYSKIVSYKSNLIIILCYLDKAEEAPSLFREIECVDMAKVTMTAAYNYNLAKVFYAFYTGHYEEGKKGFYYIFENVVRDKNDFKVDLMERFLGLCRKYNLDEDFYKEEILMAEGLESYFALDSDLEIYRFILEYYDKSGNHEKVEEIEKKYIKALEERDKERTVIRREAIEFIDRLVGENQLLIKVEEQNKKLRQAMEEATRHKSALQEVYQRIELVNELGKRVTSSLNLSTVIEMTYNNLCDTIAIDSFMLAVVEPELNRFRSIAYYRDKVLQPEFVVSLDNKDSMFVECYESKKTILSEDIHEDERYKDFKLIYFLNDIKASIYIPLRIGEQIVGVFSILSKQKGTYNFDHIMLLEGLIPYLSIAVNNAIYSEKLEHEIKAHLETQSELRKANDKLETLSSLDGLTRISNRRDFENKILNLISDAEKDKKTVTVIMVDIDNFKKYNDTYGHLAGDEALKVVAQVIRENLDKVEGLSARFGGEEFVCACSGLEFEEAKKLGEKLCDDVYARKIKHEAVSNGIMSISVGVAITENSNIDKKSELMKQADDSLYEAKNTGKNRAVIKEVP